MLLFFSSKLMEFRFSRTILVFFSLTVVVVAHAALSPEEYWDSVLPNTQIPKGLKDLLSPADLIEEKGTSVNVGKGGVNVNTGKGKPGGTTVGVGKGGVNVHAGKSKPGGSPTDVNVGKGGVNVHTGHKGKPVYVGVGQGKDPFVYNYAASEAQLHDDPNVALFFLEENLHPGSKLTLTFPKVSSSSPTFLPREVAESLPFSSKKLPEILDRFSVKPGTLESEEIEKTIKECEAPSIEGEDSYCAASLESMVDFSISKLGKEVTPISTEVEKETKLQEFRVLAVTKKSTKSDKAVVCHKQNYPYAVFYCHSTKSTRAYRVGLLGSDGTRANAVAVCHTDTAAWNPKHLAFQVLKVKPGTVPVCHFLPQDHVVWVPKY